MSDRRVQPDRRASPRGPDRRKPGRPRLVEGETTSPLTVQLNASLHDAVCLHALRTDRDISAIVRDALARFLFVNPAAR